MIKKETMNNIIERLDEIGKDESPHEYGLPIYNEANMALMREAIREEIEKEKK